MGADATADSVDGEASAQSRDERWIGLVASLGERGLEIGDQRLAEAQVRLRTRDDLVEPTAGGRKLLCCRDPALGRGRQPTDQLSEALLVVSAGPGHPFTRPLGGRVSSFHLTTESSETA